MKKALCVWLCLLAGGFSLLSGCAGAAKTKYTASSFAYFDTVTTLVGYEDDREAFDRVWAQVEASLRTYHRLYTVYDTYEQVPNLAVINRQAGQKPVKTDPAVLELLSFCKEMHTLTGGQTNVAMGSVLSLWHSYRQAGIANPAEAQLPPMEALQKAARHTKIDDLVINPAEGTVFFADEQLQLDVGAIAKGYAVEQIAARLKADGHTGYLLNVGGNVRTVGSRGDGRPWTVGIENPNGSAENPFVAYVQLKDQALVTSGSYQRYYEVDGKRYHHIIDPHTLMPGTRYLSVSVLCADSGTGDALSTALFTLAPEEGLALVQSLPDTEAMWVLPDGSCRYSPGFEKHCVNQSGQ